VQHRLSPDDAWVLHQEAREAAATRPAERPPWFWEGQLRLVSGVVQLARWRDEVQLDAMNLVQLAVLSHERLHGSHAADPSAHG
ncbi:unnamed protein product, partial [Durusdinium trenchii]